MVIFIGPSRSATSERVEAAARRLCKIAYNAPHETIVRRPYARLARRCNRMQTQGVAVGHERHSVAAAGAGGPDAAPRYDRSVREPAVGAGEAVQQRQQ